VLDLLPSARRPPAERLCEEYERDTRRAAVFFLLFHAHFLTFWPDRGRSDGHQQGTAELAIKESLLALDNNMLSGSGAPGVFSRFARVFLASHPPFTIQVPDCGLVLGIMSQILFFLGRALGRHRPLIGDDRALTGPRRAAGLDRATVGKV
jgi:hypothetical protein